MPQLTKVYFDHLAVLLVWQSGPFLLSDSAEIPVSFLNMLTKSCILQQVCVYSTNKIRTCFPGFYPKKAYVCAGFLQEEFHMNYIVLDLEWNQCPDGKDREKSSLPFEIVEIGAVRLNERMEETGRFRELVRPLVYHSLHKKTQEILPLKIEDLRTARIFPQVIRDFFSWCGKDCAYCTWGPSDLTELQRNLQFHRLEGPFPKPLFFYDIQKIFSLVYGDRKERRTLEYSIDVLGIPKEIPFHDAFSDAFYTVQVMRHLGFESIKKKPSIDYFQNPKTRKEEILLTSETESKFVSREFDTRPAVMRDRKVSSTKCWLCRKAARKNLHWFLLGSKNFCCLAWCEEHGWIKGKIRIKKTDSGKFFCVKTLKLVSAAEAQELIQKHSQLQLKHKKKALKNI